MKKLRKQRGTEYSVTAYCLNCAILCDNLCNANCGSGDPLGNENISAGHAFKYYESNK
jgi:hypothetical protein